MIILALVAMNLTDVEAKKFYHYGNTLTFLCDDETMTAEVAGTYHVETSGTITVPETFVAKDGNAYTVTAIGDNFLYFDGCVYSQGCSEVVLPKTIKRIGNSAFCKTKIKSINLPEGLESIGDSAFMNCVNLELAELPSTLQHLGGWAFCGCANITISTLPESIETLGKYVFGDVLPGGKITSFTLPDHITELPDSFFYKRKGLKEIHFPANLTRIGDYAIGFTNIEELVIPDKVTEIGKYAFYQTVRLKKVVLPSSLTSIPNSAFAYSGLTNLDFLSGSNVKEIGDEAFYYSILKEAVIPEGVTKIGSGIFRRCEKLEKISFPSTATDFTGNPIYLADNVKEIVIAEGNPSLEMTADTVLYCKNRDGRTLLNVSKSAIVDSTFVLPSDVTEIGDYAFGIYRKVNRMDFPEGLRRIGNENFWLSTLKKAILPSTLEELGDRVFLQSELEEVSLPDGLKVIPDEAFNRCEKLGKVNFPDGLESIGKFAFSETHLPAEVVLPQSVKHIGRGAFRKNAVPFERFVLPEGLETIERQAFGSSVLPNGIVIPGSVRRIEDDAFSGCGWKNIVIPEGVEYIGLGSFQLNYATEVSLPSTLKYIDANAFSDNDFEKIALPEGLRSLGIQAFIGCIYLKEIVIPDSVEVHPYAFYECTGLEKVTFPEDLQIIHPGLFTGCTSLKSVELPKNLIALENELFNGCSALEEIDFPETLECIGNWVFRGTSLKKADLSHTSLRNIISEAFADNASLTEVRLPATCNFVGAKAFAGCDNICVVEVLATEPPTAEAEAFQSPVTEQATLIVPEGSEQAYRNAEVWKEFKNIATPTSLRTTIVDSQEDERIYDLRGVEQNREKGLVIKNGIKVIKN